ncbi:hypothetical protein evm_011666 [Chilo suppressalis]|nr:hypothetical protein evm_011666 [Chilo suppressalis]
MGGGTVGTRPRPQRYSGRPLPRSPGKVGRLLARFIEGIVAGAIKDLSNNIRERGLDPLLISHSIDKRPPVTELFVLKAEIEELLVVGMSKIVLHRMTFSILFSTLTFEVSLPGIFISIASSSVDIKMMGNKFDGSISGSVNIIDTRISGRARIRLGIGGATITALTLDHSIRDIEIISSENASKMRTAWILLTAAVVTVSPASINTNVADEINFDERIIEESILIKGKQPRNNIIEGVLWGLIEDLRNVILNGNEEIPPLDPLIIEHVSLTDEDIPLPG